MNLFRAEVMKLTTVRTTLVLTLVGMALVALSASLEVFVDFGFGAFTGTAAEVADVVAAIGSNSVIVLVVALMAVTTEFRHGTIGRTLQLTPSRTRVLLAKLGANVGYALVFTALALVPIAIVLLIGTLVRDADLVIGGAAGTKLWQAAVALSLTALLGVAFGAVVRSQVMALTVALVWVFIVESLLAFLLPDLGRWLPFQALGNLFLTESSRAAMEASEMAMATPLTPGVALAVFIGWVAAFSIAAVASMRYRDV